MCEGLAALSSHAGSCIWSSHQQERQKDSAFNFQKSCRMLITRTTYSDSLLCCFSYSASSRENCASLSSPHSAKSSLIIWFEERGHLLFGVPGQNPVLEDNPQRTPAKKSGALMEAKKSGLFNNIYCGFYLFIYWILLMRSEVKWNIYDLRSGYPSVWVMIIGNLAHL